MQGELRADAPRWLPHCLPCMADTFLMEPLLTVRAAKVFLACFRGVLAMGRTATGAMAAIVDAILQEKCACSTSDARRGE